MRVVAEERLLLVDPVYCEYARNTRWRVLPGFFLSSDHTKECLVEAFPTPRAGRLFINGTPNLFYTSMFMSMATTRKAVIRYDDSKSVGQSDRSLITKRTAAPAGLPLMQLSPRCNNSRVT